MAKITRQTQQIFAGQAPSDELAVFGSMKTGTPVYSDELSQLQSSDYQQGWQNAIITDKAPFLEEMNGVMYGTTYQLAYLMQQGIPEWDIGTTYYTNSRAMGSDGNIYKSLTDDNVGNNPTTDNGTNWVNIIDGLYNKITNCILSAPNGVATHSGSTITVKAGLKVLFPNGRNADGTLNNIEYVVSNDVILSAGTTTTSNGFIVINNPVEEEEPNAYVWWDRAVFIQENEPTNLTNILLSSSVIWYKPSENIWYYLKNNSTQPYNWVNSGGLCIVAHYDRAGTTTVQSLTPYQPVELLKRSDKAEITGWGMPSDQDFELSLGASGQSYTPIADGYIKFGKIATASAQYISLTYSGYTLTSFSSFTGQNLYITIPVRRGVPVTISYNAGGNILIYKFIYAEGAK